MNFKMFGRATFAWPCMISGTKILNTTCGTSSEHLSAVWLVPEAKQSIVVSRVIKCPGFPGVFRRVSALKRGPGRATFFHFSVFSKTASFHRVVALSEKDEGGKESKIYRSGGKPNRSGTANGEWGVPRKGGRIRCSFPYTLFSYFLVDFFSFYRGNRVSNSGMHSCSPLAFLSNLQHFF